jgi:hypothetical protein
MIADVASRWRLFASGCAQRDQNGTTTSITVSEYTEHTRDWGHLTAASAYREENKIEVATHAPGRQRLPLAVSVAAAAHCDVPNIASFTVADVFTWLVDRVGISVASATKLRDQEMSGRALLRVTEDRLTQAPFCLPAGAASNIAKALETWRH